MGCDTDIYEAEYDVSNGNILLKHLYGFRTYAIYEVIPFDIYCGYYPISGEYLYTALENLKKLVNFDINFEVDQEKEYFISVFQ